MHVYDARLVVMPPAMQAPRTTQLEDTAAPRGRAMSPSQRAARDRELLERYHRDGDLRARDELVEGLIPLARRIARRYQRGNEPLDDLLQVALLGLANAIERFDLERESAFSSFAIPTMLGELKRHFRDNGWAVHVPRGLQESVQRVERSIDELSRALGRVPSVGEIAEALDITEEDVLEALAAKTAHSAASLEARRDTDDDGLCIADTLGAEDPAFELAEHRAALAPTLAILPERDREMLHLRFVEDLTQTEIADRMGISQMHVSRVLRRSLARLRTVADAHTEPHALTVAGR